LILSALIFYAIAVLNIAFGIKKKNSKVLYVLALLIIFLLMTFNSDGPDIYNYFEAYDTWIDSEGKIVKAGYMEWGYTFLMACFKGAGLDFISFRIVLTIVCLLLFTNTIKYYKANGNLVLGFYMTYLFFFDTIQLRNCVMQFILLFASRYLFQKSFSSTVKYLLFILIASSVHIVALFNLLFLIIKFSDKKSYYKNICLIATGLFLICIVIQPYLPQIANWLLQFIKRGSSYLEINVKLGYLVILVLHLIGLVALCAFRGAVKSNGEAKANIDNIIKVNIVLCLFMPLMFINSNFYRIFRNNIILTMIGLTLIYNNSERQSASDGVIASLILLNIGWFIRDMFIKNDIKLIVYPIFSGNLLFDFTQTINMTEWVIVTAASLLLITVYEIYKENRKGVNVRK